MSGDAKLDLRTRIALTPHRAWLGKTIEPMSRPNPDVALAIDQHGKHRSRGQSVRVRVGICDVLTLPQLSCRLHAREPVMQIEITDRPLFVQTPRLIAPKGTLTSISSGSKSGGPGQSFGQRRDRSSKSMASSKRIPECDVIQSSQVKSLGAECDYG